MCVKERVYYAYVRTYVNIHMYVYTVHTCIYICLSVLIVADGDH